MTRSGQGKKQNKNKEIYERLYQRLHIVEEIYFLESFQLSYLKNKLLTKKVRTTFRGIASRIYTIHAYLGLIMDSVLDYHNKIISIAIK